MKSNLFTKHFARLLCLVTLLWFVACNTLEPSDHLPTATTASIPVPATRPPSEADETLSIQLDQPFTISINQPAQFTDRELSLTFQDVLEESRCPSNVQCAWAGQARISIRVSQTGQEPVTLEMNTNPPLKQDVVTYGDFQIQLLTLDPYPEDIGQHIPASRYEATFVVSELE
jgi:hypothetical protein